MARWSQRGSNYTPPQIADLQQRAYTAVILFRQIVSTTIPMADARMYISQTVSTVPVYSVT